MNLQSGYPYSLVRYGLPYTYPRLDADLHTDVVIVGGGISGALTAYHLSKAGVPAVVVDGRTIGIGSTCASTSLLQYEIDIPLVELSDKIGAQKAAAAYQLCYAAISELEDICKKLKFSLFEKKESLYLASYKKDATLIEKEFAARQQLGFDVELWDAHTIKNKMGFENPAAIYSHVAAQTDAYMLTHALHQYSIKQGGRVFDRTGVTGISHQRRGVILHTSNGRQVKAKCLVIATGYEAMQYIREPLVKLHSTYAVVSESLQQPGDYWHNNCLIWETKDPYLYLRTTSDHRILAGGRDEPYYNPGRRDRQVARKAKDLQKDVAKKFPALPFIPEFRWTGTFATTTDGLPFIGYYPSMPHTLFALGFGGNGITFSQIAGRIIADVILGKKNKVAELFAFGRKG